MISSHSQAWAYLPVFLPVCFEALLSVGHCSPVADRYWEYESLQAVLQTAHDSHCSDVYLPAGRMNCRAGFHLHSESGSDLPGDYSPAGWDWGYELQAWDCLPAGYSKDFVLRSADCLAADCSPADCSPADWSMDFVPRPADCLVADYSPAGCMMDFVLQPADYLAADYSPVGCSPDFVPQTADCLPAVEQWGVHY